MTVPTAGWALEQVAVNLVLAGPREPGTFPRAQGSRCRTRPRAAGTGVGVRGLQGCVGTVAGCVSALPPDPSLAALAGTASSSNAV